MLGEFDSSTTRKPPLKNFTPMLTKGEGDCAFHACFGEWNGRWYEDKKVIEHRERLGEAVKNVHPEKDKKLWQLIQLGIQEAIMGGTKLGPAAKNLQVIEKATRERVEKKREALRLRLANQLEANKTIKAWIETVFKTKPAKNSPKDMVTQLDYCRGESLLSEADIKAKFQNDAALWQVYSHWIKENAPFNWAEHLNYERIKTTVLVEYANYLATQGHWLLPLEIQLIACVFKKNVCFYNRSKGEAPEPQAIAPKDYLYGGETVSEKFIRIAFDGVNHFERCERDSPSLTEHQSGRPSPTRIAVDMSVEANALLAEATALPTLSVEDIGQLKRGRVDSSGSAQKKKRLSAMQEQTNRVEMFLKSPLAATTAEDITLNASIKVDETRVLDSSASGSVGDGRAKKRTYKGGTTILDASYQKNTNIYRGPVTNNSTYITMYSTSPVDKDPLAFKGATQTPFTTTIDKTISEFQINNEKYELNSEEHKLTGRVEILKEITDYIEKGNEASKGLAFIAGHGEGKTYLLRHIFTRYNKDKNNLCIWVNLPDINAKGRKSHVESEKKRIYELALNESLSKLFEIFNEKNFDFNVFLKSFRNYQLKEKNIPKKILIIFDNAQYGAIIKKLFFTKLRKNKVDFRVIALSINKHLNQWDKDYWDRKILSSFPEMRKKDAKAYITEHIQRLHPENTFSETEKLAELLDYNFLVLTQARAYIRASELSEEDEYISISNYIECFEENKKELLKYYFEESTYDANKENFYTAVKMVLDKLITNSENKYVNWALLVLWISSLLARHKEIPCGLIKELVLVNEKPVLQSNFNFQEIAKLFHEYSFIDKIDNKNNVIFISSLIQEVSFFVLKKNLNSICSNKTLNGQDYRLSILAAKLYKILNKDVYFPIFEPVEKAKAILSFTHMMHLVEQKHYQRDYLFEEKQLMFAQFSQYILRKRSDITRRLLEEINTEKLNEVDKREYTLLRGAHMITIAKNKRKSEKEAYFNEAEKFILGAMASTTADKDKLGYIKIKLLYIDFLILRQSYYYNWVLNKYYENPDALCKDQANEPIKSIGGEKHTFDATFSEVTKNKKMMVQRRYSKKFDFKKIIDLLLELENFMKEYPEQVWIYLKQKINSKFAFCYSRNREYSKAIEYYQKNLKLIDKVNEKAKCHAAIGEVYYLKMLMSGNHNVEENNFSAIREILQALNLVLNNKYLMTSPIIIKGIWHISQCLEKTSHIVLELEFRSLLNQLLADSDKKYRFCDNNLKKLERIKNDYYKIPCLTEEHINKRRTEIATVIKAIEKNTKIQRSGLSNFVPNV